MKNKVAYIFVFMILLDLLAACSKPTIYTVELNKAYLNLRNFSNNTTLIEDDVIEVSKLELTMQYEFVQTASNFKLPSIFSHTATAKKVESQWSFQNNFSDLVVLAKTESGADRNITSDCSFIYQGVTYSTSQELITKLNMKLIEYGSTGGSSPSIGYKIRFNSNLVQTEKQLIKVKTELSNKELLNSSVYIEVI